MRLKLSQIPSRIRASDLKAGDTVYLRRGIGPDYDLEAVDVKTVRAGKMIEVNGGKLTLYPDQLVVGVPS